MCHSRPDLCDAEFVGEHSCTTKSLPPIEGMQQCTCAACWSCLLATSASLRGHFQARPYCTAGIVQANAEGARLINTTFGVRPPMPWAEQVGRYKYMVHVHGNGFVAASRSTIVLLADTVPLWQQSEGFEFFYYALQPYVHYIPLSRSLDDLFPAIEWARTHPEECKHIIQEGQSFAKRYFNTQFSNLYMHALLNEYAKLLKFRPAPTAAYHRVVVDDELRARVERSSGGCKYKINQ